MSHLAFIKTIAKAAAADRKGATALEYALIAAAVAIGVMAAYRAMFDRLSEFINTIKFTATGT